MTLNDLERRNGRYFALFQRILVASGRTAQKFTFAISSPDEFLFTHAYNLLFQVPIYMLAVTRITVSSTVYSAYTVVMASS